MQSELSLTEDELKFVDARLIKDFEAEARRVMRLADVNRKFGEPERAAQLEKEVELLDRKIHYLRTGEVLDGA